MNELKYNEITGEFEPDNSSSESNDTGYILWCLFLGFLMIGGLLIFDSIIYFAVGGALLFIPGLVKVIYFDKRIVSYEYKKGC